MLRVNRLSPLVLAPLLLFQFCSQDESFAPASQKVQFTFALDENHTRALPAGSTVILTITTPSGDAVLADHEVAIDRVDNAFITKPIPLGTNQYVVSEFMVVHDEVALFVTPKAGSEFSKEVNTPLSYALPSRDGSVIPLQVVETRNAAAEKFGYKTLKVKNAAQWKIMVFTREDGMVESSPAWHYLITPGLAYGGQLAPGMNTLAFEGDPAHTYTLLVEKAGYVTYTTDFVYNDIKGNGNKPFKVILDRVPDENTFTISPPKAEGEFTFRLGLRGTGSLVIDWGDGTVETLNFAPDPSSPGADASYVTPSHEYGLSGSNDQSPVSISGDLDKIFAFESISVYANEIDPRNLSNLQTIYLYGLPINGLLDLSSNSKLQSLSLEATYAWEIRLPESHDINDVLLSDLDGVLSESVVDSVIDNIYRNAIANNITSGTMTILRPVELSAESAQKVQELVDDYDWAFSDVE